MKPQFLLMASLCFFASLGHANASNTNQFISALADLLERKVIADDELVALIDAADEGKVSNPISEAKAEASVEHFISRQMLQDYVNAEDLDTKAVGVWASKRLVEQERERLGREETREDTRIPWEKPIATVLSLGWDHACAVKADETITCWGSDKKGEILPLFDDSVCSSRDSESSIFQYFTSFFSLLAETFQSVSVGDHRTCAVKTDGHVACWGSGLWGYGQGLQPPANLGPVLSISVRDDFACAVKADSRVACWGKNSHGQSSPPSNLGPVQSVSTGGFYACAVKADSTVACWGSDTYGEDSPPANLGVVQSVSAGGNHACAVKADSTVACWGFDSDSENSPPANLGPVLSVSAGGVSTCAVKVDGTAECWGGGVYLPTPPANLGPVLSISVTRAYGSVCALKGDGSVACWGIDWRGQTTPPAGLRVKGGQK